MMKGEGGDHMFNRLLRLGAIFALILGVSLGFAPAPAHAGGENITENPDPNRPHYVKIAPLILPLVGDNGIEQTISIVVVIEATSKEAADNILELSPRLNDAFITDLYGTIDRREKMRNGLLDVAYIKDRLSKLCTKILGDDKVKDILIQGVTQRAA